MATATTLPSASDPGKAWLAQFDASDHETARMLMDSILYVDHNTFHRGLEALLDQVAAESTTRVALYAAREMKKRVWYFKDKKSRPLTVAANQSLGSEGTIAHLTGRLAKKSAVFADHPSLSGLKRAGIETIVFVDDMVGSGARIAEFWRAFVAHPTMKSRWSYHRYKLEVVCFSASRTGEARAREAVGKRGAEIAVRFVTPAREGALVWDAKELGAIRKLCTKYGPLTGAKPYLFCGYKDGLFTTVFAHGCPNNAPAILWKGSKSWRPLFPNRAVPPELATAGARRSPRTVRSVFAPPNVETGPLELEGKVGSQLLRVLQVAARSGRRVDQLAIRTGLTMRSTQHAIQVGQQLGLIDSHLTLTTSGMREIRRKRRLENRNEIADDTSRFYFKG